MQKITVTSNEAGQRLDKLLAKHMNQAPKSFFYKMLRKKNIKLNGKKAEGNEKLAVGDEITLFLSDETIGKFSGNRTGGSEQSLKQALASQVRLDVVYEDAQVLFLNKPAGMLSQKAKPEDVSLNEYMTAYLIQTGAVKEEELAHFRPGICNRLDRNTSGLVAAGKTLGALQDLSAMFRERTMEKYYYTIVRGVLREAQHISGFLAKDEGTNQVRVWDTQPEDSAEEARPIETGFRPLGDNGELTLLEVHLITGRTHQIRAHLASQGHPVIGDGKYGEKTTNRRFQYQYGLNSQLLHACYMRFPVCEGTLADLSGKTICAPLPKLFRTICEGEGLTWQHGIPEA